MAPNADRRPALPADAVRGYAIYDYRFAIATRSPAAAQLLDRLYAPYAVVEMTGQCDLFGVARVRRERRASWQIRVNDAECSAYGSLGGVVVMLTWLYLSAFVSLLGAVINAQSEWQTTADTASPQSALV